MDSSDSESEQFYECDDNFNLRDGGAENFHQKGENDECEDVQETKANHSQDSTDVDDKESIENNCNIAVNKNEQCTNEKLPNIPDLTRTEDIKVIDDINEIKYLEISKESEEVSTANLEIEDQIWHSWNDNWTDEDQIYVPHSDRKLQVNSQSEKKMETEKEEESLWDDNDNWGNASDEEKEENLHIQNALTALTDNREESSWGNWGNWLQTAANITTTVSQGLTNAIGVPDPEELARQHLDDEARSVLQEDRPKSTHEPEIAIPFGLGIGNIVKLVETTGSRVITGGLGTLETIGKKTYEVLQENDPQLRKKRAFLKHLEGEKPVLSQILREAKERAEEENKERVRVQFAKKANYETIFDDHQGLVHLEALEMLSKECDLKLEKIVRESSSQNEIKETLDQIKDLCELAGDEDDEECAKDEGAIKTRIGAAVIDMHVQINFDKLFETFEIVKDWIQSNESRTCDEIQLHAIEHLAQITAMSMERYHKSGELLLVKSHRSTVDEADSLVQLTTGLTDLINVLSVQYTEKLKECETSAEENIRKSVSCVFLEAANSARYIQDAFQLLVPVIQIGAV